MGAAQPSRESPPKWTVAIFQSLLDALPDAVLMAKQAATIVVANNQAVRMFGYNRDELIGRPIESLVPSKLLGRQASDLETYFRDPFVLPNGISLEVFAQRCDGTDFPAVINLNPVTTEAGTFVILMIRETAYRRARDSKESEVVPHEMREGEAHFHLAAESAPVMTWMSRMDMLRTYFSESWLDFTGRSLDQESGNGWEEGIHPDDLQRCLNIYTQAFYRREEFTMEYRLLRRDGEYRWIYEKGMPRSNADHSFAGYTGSCVEMTGVKRMEEALRQKELDLQESQRLAGVGSWHWRAGNERATWTEELYRIAGRDPSSPAPTYKEHSTLFTSESWDRLSRAIQAAMRGENSRRTGFGDGSPRWHDAMGPSPRRSATR